MSKGNFKMKNYMRKTYLLIVILISISLTASAQKNKQDVVYLKNGSIIRGKIIEQIFNTSLKIQTADKNIFAYKMDEIENIKKEAVPIVLNNTQDTLIMKNGNIIIGEIIERVLNKTIKIQTAESSVFIFRMDELENKTKEVASDLEIKTTQDNQSFSSTQGKATVYIVRQSITGFAIPFKVSCDNNYIGTTMAKNYISVVLDSGEHTFVSSAENKSELIINIDADKTYYLEQKVTMGILFARNKLVMLDEISGRKALSKCQLAK